MRPAPAEPRHVETPGDYPTAAALRPSPDDRTHDASKGWTAAPLSVWDTAQTTVEEAVALGRAAPWRGWALTHADRRATGELHPRLLPMRDRSMLGAMT